MNRYFIAHPEIFDCLHDAVIATDLKGTVVACNRAARVIYEWPDNELLGQNIALLYPHSQREKMRRLIAEVHAKGRATGEFLNVTRGGREIWIHLAVSLLRNDEGMPYAMIGFSIDITNTKLEEQQRRDLEERSRASREAAGVGTWFIDLKTQEVQWDEQSARLLHVPKDVKPSLALFLEIVHPEDRHQLEKVLHQPLAPDAEYRAEYRVTDMEGRTHYVVGKGRTLYDEHGKPKSLLGVGWDITAQKTAERELERAQAKYRAFVEAPFIGVGSGNLDRFTDVNDTYCNLLGYSREELTSGAVTWPQITPPEYLDRDYRAMHQLVERGIAVPFEKEYVRSDGSRVRVILGAVLVSREPLEWSCFVLDITQHHKALEALRANDMMASAARLGSLLAHEINNPLASLTNIFYLLEHSSDRWGDTDLLAAGQEALERVTRITRQMIGIYSDRENATRFDVVSVLEDTLASFEARTRSKNVRVMRSNKLEDPMIVGVEPEFRRLLSALLENAVEHTTPGGAVAVRVQRAREWNERGWQGIRILVSDDGPGISQPQVSTLFQPFHSTKPMKGSGLGLWMCRGIAEKHGGSVRVKTSTRAGVSGTSVAVFLPQTSDARMISRQG